jgi:putative endonuclease
LLKFWLNLFMYYFYVLFSEIDNQYYYGSTKDLRKRFTEHDKGKVTSTRYRRPLKLVYFESYDSVDKARHRERQVKNSGSIRTNLHKRI